jgi:periplasmic protein TonB
MFEDSLFDSGGALRKRKTWPKLVSFVIEVGAIGLLVLAPLIYTQGLPKQQMVDILRMPSPPAGRPPAEAVHEQPRASRDHRELDDKVLREPSRIPLNTQMVRDEPSSGGPPSLDRLVEGGTSDGVPNAVITEIARSVPPTVVKPAPPQKLRVSSGVAAGMLVYQLKPIYPRLAMQARIQGTVVLQAVIGKDGIVHDLHVVSGHPMLVPAAIEAVKQWRYRPYLLNNEPVEVDTQINVNFTLSGG